MVHLREAERCEKILGFLCVVCCDLCVETGKWSELCFEVGTYGPTGLCRSVTSSRIELLGLLFYLLKKKIKQASKLVR